MMIQLYTVIDRKTGEELYRNKSSKEIASEMGVKPKQISAWAMDGNRKYIVTRKFPYSKKPRARQTQKCSVSLEQYSVLGSVFGMSYGKLRQAIDAGEIILERRNGSVKAWKAKNRKTLLVEEKDGAVIARWV